MPSLLTVCLFLAAGGADLASTSPLKIRIDLSVYSDLKQHHPVCSLCLFYSSSYINKIVFFKKSHYILINNLQIKFYRMRHHYKSCKKYQDEYGVSAIIPNFQISQDSVGSR